MRSDTMAQDYDEGWNEGYDTAMKKVRSLLEKVWGELDLDEYG